MSDDQILKQPYPRPLSGSAVQESPSGLIPVRAPIRGKYVELMPQQTNSHAADLFAAGHESKQALAIWDYMNHMIFKGRNRDTAWYSILDDEWAEVRGILEAWLVKNPDQTTVKLVLGFICSTSMLSGDYHVQ